jgi:serine/threonine protein kinase
MANSEGDDTAANPTGHPFAPPLEGGAPIGRYIVESVLARGGFAWTYLVVDQSLGRRLVAKELCPSGTRRVGAIIDRADCDRFDQLLELFRAECVSLARLSLHPNVVTVHDVVDANGTSYLLTQYVPSPQTSARTFEEAWSVFVQLTDALVHLHAMNVVHRDVKPDNVLIGESPAGWVHPSQVVLIDFGSALTNWNHGLNTSNGPRFVSPGFSAPEAADQVVFDVKASAPTALDIFSLGATGRFLLDRLSVDEQRKCSGPLVCLLAECMSPHPSDRPSAVEVRDRLDHLRPVVRDDTREPLVAASGPSPSAFWDELRLSEGTYKSAVGNRTIPGGVRNPGKRSKSLDGANRGGWLARRWRKVGAYDE